MWNIGQISSIYARDISSNRRIAFVYTVSISFLVLGYRTLSIFHDILYSRILLYIPFLLSPLLSLFFSFSFAKLTDFTKLPYTGRDKKWFNS